MAKSLNTSQFVTTFKVDEYADLINPTSSITKWSLTTTSIDVSGYVNRYPNEYVVHMFYLIYTIVIMVTGCIGNVLVIGAVWLHRRLRNIGNIFIVNLAVADMCVSLIIDSFAIVGVVTEGLFFVDKDGLCELIGVICVTSCACSMVSIAGIAVNRYVSICHWARYRDIYNRRTVPVILLGMWVFSFLLDVPSLAGWGDHRFDWKTMMCGADLSVDVTATIFFTVVGCGIPLVAIIYCYVRIYNHVRKSTARLNRVTKQTGMSSRRRSPSDMRLVRSLFIIVIAYLTMWTPYLLIGIIGDTIAPRNAYMFSALLAHTNSSVNCFIYAATNKNFREGYVYFFNWVFRRATPASKFLSNINLSASQKTIDIEDQV